MSLNLYDRAGWPLTLEEWARLSADFAYKRLALTELPNFDVSTVWLGIDHDFAGHGPPLIFETMVFASGSCDDEMVLRYPTEDRARFGHQMTVGHVVIFHPPPALPAPTKGAKALWKALRRTFARRFSSRRRR